MLRSVYEIHSAQHMRVNKIFVCITEIDDANTLIFIGHEAILSYVRKLKDVYIKFLNINIEWKITVHSLLQ